MQLVEYSPGENGDAALLQWYMQLVVYGDMEKILGPSLYSIAAFMRHFTDPGGCVYYLIDDKGWYAVAWTFPLIGGGTWGLWIRPEKRPTGSRLVLNFIMQTIQASLDRFPVLVNTAKREPIVAQTKRLGYEYIGKIPYLFEGDTCHILYLTRDMFQPIYAKWEAYYGSR